MKEIEMDRERGILGESRTIGDAATKGAASKAESHRGR